MKTKNRIVLGSLCALMLFGGTALKETISASTQEKTTSSSIATIKNILSESMESNKADTNSPSRTSEEKKDSEGTKTNVTESESSLSTISSEKVDSQNNEKEQVEQSKKQDNNTTRAPIDDYKNGDIYVLFMGASEKTISVDDLLSKESTKMPSDAIISDPFYGLDDNGNGYSVNGSGTPEGSPGYYPAVSLDNYVLNVQVTRPDGTSTVYAPYHPSSYDPVETIMEGPITIKNSDLAIGKNEVKTTVTKVLGGKTSSPTTGTIIVNIPNPKIKVDAIVGDKLDSMPNTDIPVIDVSSTEYPVSYTVNSDHAKTLTTQITDSYGDVAHTEQYKEEYDNSKTLGKNHTNTIKMTDLTVKKHAITVTTTDDQGNKTDKKFILNVEKPTKMLKINSINNLDYGDAIKIPNKTINLTPLSGLDVDLSAINTGNWQLNVKSTGLTDDPDAFVFKSDTNATEQVINNDAGITVLSGNGINDAGKDFNEVGTGILLKAKPSKLRVTTYKAELNWTLLSVPAK